MPGRAVAQAVSSLLLTADAQVHARSVKVGFMVGKVELGQAFLRGLRFSPISTAAPYSLTYHLGDGQWSR
jgi:hypothetical protein